MQLLKWLRPDRKEIPAATLGSLQIFKPWARSSSSLPEIAGGFMTLVNKGDTDRLLSASCGAVPCVKIHAIRVKGPRLQMHAMEDGLVVPPANQQVLKPRGYHLLLSGLAMPLVAGTKLLITLVFERAGSLTVDFVVEAPGPVGYHALRSHP
ncbi:MAG: hypothetical protein JWQ58_60 [Reyranella sp.]|nr:hypothetical protein [Reyranella sp.]